MDFNLRKDTNPMIQSTIRYPVHIVCVFEDSENNDFPIIHEVRKYCLENHMTFYGRQYNCDQYPEDISVCRLPAFHIYYKKSILETQYFDTDPVHKIQLVVWAYQDEMRAKERAKLRRQERWNNFKAMFTIDFRKKLALDLDASLSHKRDL